MFDSTRDEMKMEKFTCTTFMLGDQMAGGMMPILPEWRGRPPTLDAIHGRGIL
jgi:hypothetical protein